MNDDNNILINGDNKRDFIVFSQFSITINKKEIAEKRGSRYEKNMLSITCHNDESIGEL